MSDALQMINATNVCLECNYANCEIEKCASLSSGLVGGGTSSSSTGAGQMVLPDRLFSRFWALNQTTSSLRLEVFTFICSSSVIATTASCWICIWASAFYTGRPTFSQLRSLCFTQRIPLLTRTLALPSVLLASIWVPRFPPPPSKS